MSSVNTNDKLTPRAAAQPGIFMGFLRRRLFP